VALLACLVCLVSAGCASRRARASLPHEPPAIPAPTAPPDEPPPELRPAPQPPPAAFGGYTEEGAASWYGEPFHGRRASNGEIYNMYKLTAAHRTLPFESIVRVTNLLNGRQTNVRITDRGPFVENRILDLSFAAARDLDMIGRGVVPVRLELLSGSSPLQGFFAVQVGAFLDRGNADRLRAQLEQRFQAATLQEYEAPNGLFYRVRIGRLPPGDAARQLAEQLRGEGFLAFVVRLDE